MFHAIRDFFETQVLAVSGGGHDADPEHALQLATATLLVEMTRADDVVKPVERHAVMAAIRRSFSIGDGETRQLLDLAEQEADHATSLYEFTRLISDRFDAERKARVIELLWEVAYADGEIDKYEEHLVRRLADLIHVPHRSFIRAKHKALNRIQAAEQ